MHHKHIFQEINANTNPGDVGAEETGHEPQDTSDKIVTRTAQEIPE